MINSVTFNSSVDLGIVERRSLDHLHTLDNLLKSGTNVLNWRTLGNVSLEIRGGKLNHSLSANFHLTNKIHLLTI